MAPFFIALVSGLIFGCGILLSGMANPAKILNFFDVAGPWDPSLAFVMGGALTVTAIGYRLVWRRGKPIAAETFQLPVKRQLDSRLLLGSAIFGVGWGIAGFCPGGAIPALGLMRPEVALFVATMAAGIFIAQFVDQRIAALKRDNALSKSRHAA